MCSYQIKEVTLNKRFERPLSRKEEQANEETKKKSCPRDFLYTSTLRDSGRRDGRRCWCFLSAQRQAWCRQRRCGWLIQQQPHLHRACPQTLSGAIAPLLYRCCVDRERGAQKASLPCYPYSFETPMFGGSLRLFSPVCCLDDSTLRSQQYCC